MITARDAVLAEAATYAGGKATWTAFGGSVAVFASEVGDDLLLSAQGTHDELGWGIDIAAWMVKVDVIQGHPNLPPCHAGVTKAVDEMVDDIAKLIGDRKPHLIGHSQGGGVMQNLGARLADRGVALAALWLFASMRVFLDAPDILYGTPIYAWRCGGDRVPDLPPLAWRPLMIHLPGPADESSHHIPNFVAALAPPEG